MKKNKWLNALMVVLIVVIAVSGVMLVGANKGWFDKKTGAGAETGDLIGVAEIERGGVAYSVGDGTVLRDGDRLTTKTSSGLTLNAGENQVVLNENTSLQVVAAAVDHFTLELTRGEAFVTAGGSLTLTLSGQAIPLSDAVLLVSAQTGSASVSCLSGRVTLPDGTAADAGESISLLTGDVTLSALSAASLDEFALTQALSSARTLCFTAEELQSVTASRTEEKAAALDASGSEVIGQTEAVPPAADTTAPAPSGDAQAPAGDNADVRTCTLEIRCDTILGNLENLTAGKNAYVPANGTILGTVRVAFSDGETVFDVLKRACTAQQIQLEYSWTPLYDSYYIEGINNLYEFDCGSESGWMYKVNGWFPNYGCSSYSLKDGDVIVWCYTCNGLGADVGGSVY